MSLTDGLNLRETADACCTKEVARRSGDSPPPSSAPLTESEKRSLRSLGHDLHQQNRGMDYAYSWADEINYRPLRFYWNHGREIPKRASDWPDPIIQCFIDGYGVKIHTDEPGPGCALIRQILQEHIK